MDDNRRGMSNFTAVLLGAIAGAAAVLLYNKDTREKLKLKAKYLMEKGEKTVEEAKTRVDEARDRSREKLAKSLDSASERLKKQPPRRAGLS